MAGYAGSGTYEQAYGYGEEEEEENEAEIELEARVLAAEVYNLYTYT